MKGTGTTFVQILASLAAASLLALFVLPIVGLMTRAPWSTVATRLAAPETAPALGISLLVSTAAVCLGLAGGCPLAWWLTRSTGFTRHLLRALITLPLVMPPVVAGVGLLTIFGTQGLLGPPLHWLGVRLPFSLPGCILAVTFVSAPFLVLAVEAGMASVDRRLEQQAETLGASPWLVWWTVTLPAMLPAVRTGCALTFARALGEFGASLTFAGNLRGRTQTLPLAVYETLQTDFDGAILLSLILVTVCWLILLLLRPTIAGESRGT